MTYIMNERTIHLIHNENKYRNKETANELTKYNTGGAIERTNTRTQYMTKYIKTYLHNERGLDNEIHTYTNKENYPTHKQTRS